MTRPSVKLMSVFFLVLAMHLMASCGGGNNMSELSATLKAPVAKISPKELVNHGHSRIDNYYWLRDDSRQNPDVISYLQAENNYAEKVLKPIRPLVDKIYNEIIGRMEKNDSSVPVKQNGYWYSYRFKGDMEYPVFYRQRDGESTQQELLLDVNELAKGHDYFSVANLAVSHNNDLLAYAYDDVSRRQYKIVFKNIRTGEMLPDILENVEADMVWANDDKSFFYIKKDPQTLLGYQVFKHTLGTDFERDELIYEETDTSFYTGLSKSKDNQFIYIHHSSTTTKGVSLINANKPTRITPFLPLEREHEYYVSKLDEEFYVLTNWDAINFRIMKVSQGKTQDKSSWQEVISHRSDTLLEDFELFDRYLAVKERRNGQSYIKVISLESGLEKMLEFDESVYVVELDDNLDFSENYLRIYYSSPITPGSVFDVELETLERNLRKREKIIGDYEPSNYETRRITVGSRDGKDIPVTLMFRRDMFQQDGSNPLHQYGYGSYGLTIDPYFRSSALSLADRGFVVAAAHIRGSEMLGRDWYFDGKLSNKVNSFNDFIDVTKGLVERGYGNAEKIYAAGGSAGGLLMGAVVNMAPNLYHGVAAHVPFVDVVTTMSDPSVPLTSNEFDEWGNPQNEKDYHYMLSYSPYDQVRALDYPNLLVTAGLHDSQVQYFEPAKWVAKLRSHKTDENVLVMDTDMSAGHSGSSGRFRRYETRALEYAFFVDLASR